MANFSFALKIPISMTLDCMFCDCTVQSANKFHAINLLGFVTILKWFCDLYNGQNNFCNMVTSNFV